MKEVSAFLGRARYERTVQARGWRNGNRPRQVQTTEGELEVQVPQVRGTAERFVSKVLPNNARTALRTRPLETLIIGGWLRGLSDRDIESLVAEAGLGAVSKSTVSEITQQLRARYHAFRARSLAEVRLLVLFLDATYLPTRPSGPNEGVLVAWGYDEDGHRVLVDVVLGPARAAQGLAGDGPWSGAAGAARAAAGGERRGARAGPRDRGAVAGCRSPAVHGAPVPKRARQAAQEGRGAAPAGRGGVLVGAGRGQISGPRGGVVAALGGRVGARLPRRRRLSGGGPAGALRLRSTNLLERSLEEVKRRTKVIGRFPGETSCLSRCWAVLDLFIATARGLGLTPLEQRQLTLMRAQRMALTPESQTA